MDETMSVVCEVENVPGIGVHGDESDNSRTGLGNESLSGRENIFVGSRSDNSMSSEHGMEAIINVSVFDIFNFFHGKQMQMDKCFNIVMLSLNM
jgi:hypothetical protein